MSRIIDWLEVEGRILDVVFVVLIVSILSLCFCPAHAAQPDGNAIVSAVQSQRNVCMDQGALLAAKVDMLEKENASLKDELAKVKPPSK